MNYLVKIEVIDGELFASSKKIARALEKEHKHVLAKCREILNGSEFRPVDYVDAKGEVRQEYFLTKDGFILLCMNYQGYNDFKRAYIAEFNRMEAQLKNNVAALPQDYASALRALANEVEQKQIAQNERDLAIATKAEIGSRREATAMNTASQAVKEVKRLEIELDRSMQYASVKAVEMATGARIKWRPLRDYCTNAELEVKKIFDANYGKVNAYPAKAWLEVYAIDLNELDRL